jgi:hypothetical protein
MKASKQKILVKKKNIHTCFLRAPRLEKKKPQVAHRLHKLPVVEDARSRGQTLIELDND